MSFPDCNRVELVNTTDGSQATVYLQGAHLASWRTKDGEEHLYNSPMSVYKDGKAIRGGVPLIFPQFSDLGPLPTSHGFLRVSHGWLLESCRNKGPTCVAVFGYEMACGPEMTGFDGARATLRYRIEFTAEALAVSMTVTNTAKADSLSFGYAFHSYFGVADITNVAIAGFDDDAWLDDLEDRKKCPPQPIHDIHEEVDRIYLDQDKKPVSITTQTAAGAPKKLTIVGENMTEAVLWNPWAEKIKGMSDMPTDGYKKFVCVEHGRIIENVTLAPSESWTGTQRITVRE